MDKISVIIPTIGRASLKKCLNSLLNQELMPDEIIVVNNSKDKAESLLRLPRVRYIYEKKSGPGFARNRGIKEAKNDILAFIDDDCLADKNWLKNLKSFFIKNKNSIVIGENKNGLKNNLFSCVEYFDEQIFFKKDFYLVGNQIVSFWLDSKNFIISKKLIKKKKLFFRNLKIMAEDLDFSLQANSKKINILYCQKAKVYHFARKDILAHFRREAGKGLAAKELFSIWKDFKNKELKKVYFQKQFIWKKLYSEKQLKRKLFKEIFFRKNLFFIISFWLVFLTNKVINRLFFSTRVLDSIFYKLLDL